MTKLGLNPEPMASYALADRFVCSKCGTVPQITKAEGASPVVITFSCHGEKETRSYEKKDLVFTQFIFGDGK